MGTVRADIGLSETLIGCDVRVVVRINDEQGERPYQLAYNHDVTELGKMGGDVQAVI